MSETLYVRSINEKIKKNEVQRSLYHLFSQYGQVIDVVVTRRAGMRGQAHVVFSDDSGAAVAMKALQGFPFFGKAIKIEPGKTKSHAVVRLEGRVQPPQSREPKGKKRPLEEDAAAANSANKKQSV